MLPYPDIHERVKTLEERYTLVRQLIDNLEESIVNEKKQLEEKIKNIESELNSLKKATQELNTKIDAIMNQLSMFATSDRVEVIEKYLDLINPFELLTKKEAYSLISKIVDRKVRDILKSLENKNTQPMMDDSKNKFKNETIIIE